MAFAQSPAKQSLVFISFDHVVAPPLSRRTMDSGLLYLQIRNNSHTAIQVLAEPAEAGAQGVELVHEIVETSSADKPAPGWISPPGHYSPIEEATSVDLAPNSGLLFSVPINHVGPSWGLRLTFHFVQPQLRSAKQSEGAADFTWAGVPKDKRDAWKKAPAR